MRGGQEVREEARDDPSHKMQRMKVTKKKNTAEGDRNKAHASESHFSVARESLLPIR